MTHKLSRLLATLLVAAPSAALAAPVSLDCYVIKARDGVRADFQIQLNEDTESAVYVYNSRNPVRFRAWFTPGRVTLGDGEYVIDRTTLEIIGHAIVGGVDLGIDRGKCSVMTAKRAF